MIWQPSLATSRIRAKNVSNLIINQQIRLASSSMKISRRPYHSVNWSKFLGRVDGNCRGISGVCLGQVPIDI